MRAMNQVPSKFQSIPAPTLAKVAVRVLAQPSSAGACERLWSAFANVQSIKRSRLTAERCNDLVFGYANMRLLRASERLSKRPKGTTIAWQCMEASDDDDDDDVQ